MLERCGNIGDYLVWASSLYKTYKLFHLNFKGLMITAEIQISQRSSLHSRS